MNMPEFNITNFTCECGEIVARTEGDNVSCDNCGTVYVYNSTKTYMDYL